MPKPKVRYCKIVAVDTEEFWGTETWILTHECGKVEKRIRRSRNSRTIKPAPKRVRCEPQKADDVNR